MLQQDYPIVKPTPIYLAEPARRRRTLPLRILVVIAANVLIALGYSALPSDGGAVLIALGCAGLFALVFKPTRVPTTSRVYTVWGVRLRGDVETDTYFDEGR